jgi:hypothetical protein
MYVLYMSYRAFILVSDQRDGDSKEKGGAISVRAIARSSHHPFLRNIRSLEKHVLSTKL